MRSIELGVAPSETSVLIHDRTTQKAKRTSCWRSCLVVGIAVGLVVVALSALSLNESASLQSRKTYVLSGSSTDLQNGSQFFEGDLKNIPPSEVAKAYGQKAAQQYAKRFGLPFDPRVKADDLVASERSLWPGGVFYYAYSTTLTQTSKNRFIEAMQHVSQKVPRVTFVERTDQPAYTTILTPTEGCYSSDVGRRGNPFQEIGVTDLCSVGNSIHEIMHSMGFWHEQTRPDRDTWVNIHTENIENQKESAFARRQEWETNDRGSPYDYGSIMHYPSWAFSKNGQDTITKKVNKGPTMGQRDGMSPEDEFQMNAAYPRCDMRTNLALGKATFQSSTAWDGASSRAVDGNTDTSYFTGNSCTHTELEDHPWWTVDLGSSKDVCSVVLTNRGDCCSDRLVNFDIFVTNTRPSAGFRPNGADLCVRVKNTFSGTKSFSCEGVKRGQYVGVQIREQQPLTLCEVQIYGPPPTCSTTTLALHKIAYQSTTSTAYNWPASRAVDGNTDNSWAANSCTHTTDEDHPWWVVDLGVTTNVCGIVITNRGDCCTERLTNFDIFVTNRRPSSGFRPTTAELCRRMPASYTFTGTKTFDCIGMVSGQFVGVQIREMQPLTLCEVQIRTPV